ncbi:MAG: DEAD/DEAH box helicase [Acidobacteria bacterium]|nr:DEAD/DEAH box helicase [Acidobacteriota bacterium]
MSLGLTPAGHLRWTPRDGDPVPPAIAPLQTAFEADWREALFTLAADRTDTHEAPDARFWQEIAERHLTALCHLPEHESRVAVEPPTAADCAAWILSAPPMRGGEYLSEDSLQGVWSHLDAWVRETVEDTAGGLPAFLRARAPSWHQVGRVCFHLAENRNDPERPFAFMATYASGFGASGRVKHLPLRRALQQYAGAKNRAALISLLSPIQQAAETCDWVRELAESGDVYQPLAWTPDRAYRLLRSVPELESSGLSVRLPNWWRKRPRPRVSVTIGDTAPSMVGAEAMVDFDVGVALGGEPLSRAELETLLDGDGELVLLKGQWVEVDRERLREAIEHWEAVREMAGDDGISFVEGMRLLAGASADLRHEDRTEAERPWVHVDAGDGMRELLAGMRQPDALDPAALGGALRATLRPYQRDGVAWLRLLTTLGLGACLADDMGLGKTIQVLALLLCDRAGDAPPPAPALLVIPASLLGNWRREAERFAPSLALRFLHPAETDRQTLTDVAAAPARRLAGVDLAVTTYAMLQRQPWLADVQWRLVILDEAQAVKNPDTRQSRAVRKLAARARIALTGTPVENRLGDLWALFDFLNPGLLGSRDVFNRFVKELQRRDEQPFAPLRRLVAPYILRRLKTDRRIIADLPDKTETTRDCHLTRKQVALYQRIVRAMQDELEATEGIQRRGVVLRSLMRLKQTCNHPSQLAGDGDYRPGDSGKFARLAEICEELSARQERALVFTQFREIIDPLSEYLATIFGRPGLVLHGATGVKRRQALVDGFQRDDGPPFFILSLKAGGTGLNLTAASHVIHFDRWWNPAVENQATDRAFRIGQRRNVLVHRFVTRGTIEEKIDRMIAEKRQLADDLLDGESEVNLTELSDDELIDLVRLDVTRANPQAAS